MNYFEHNDGQKHRKVSDSVEPDFAAITDTDGIAVTEHIQPASDPWRGVRVALERSRL